MTNTTEHNPERKKKTASIFGGTVNLKYGRIISDMMFEREIANMPKIDNMDERKKLIEKVKRELEGKPAKKEDG